MGLPICQHLCKKMGGQIKVTSVKDKGSKFWFVLPVTKPVQRRIETRNEGSKTNNNGTDSVFITENMFKQSKATEGSIINENSPNNNSNLRQTPFNEESYESKEIELEDIYESEDGQLGIPAGVAISNHLFNENILWSFFPGKIMDGGDLSSGDEEQKGFRNGDDEP